MSKPMKPMKSSTCEDIHLPQLKFPLLASIKLDGYRCPIKDNQALSSSLNRIRNRHIFKTLSDPLLEGLDGELLLANQDDRNTPGNHEFNLVSSAVSNGAGEPDFIYWVFDTWNTDLPCIVRLAELQERIEALPAEVQHYVKLLPHVLCESLEEEQEFEAGCLERDYEGVMLNSIDGLYKFGEGTLKEQILLKRKPFVDAEARVTGFIEQETNTNEATKDLLGRTKRSSSKEGMVLAGTLGKIEVTTKRWGDFCVGKGRMTHARAKLIWDTKYTPQAEIKIGDIITFKYQLIGTKDKPRLPVFKHVRPHDDITAERMAEI